MDFQVSKRYHDYVTSTLCAIDQLHNWRLNVQTIIIIVDFSAALALALLQQVFPRPRIKDMLEANSIVQEAKKNVRSGIRLMPISPQFLVPLWLYDPPFKWLMM